MRLGEQEEHDRWDARDQLRPVLNQAVRAFLFFSSSFLASSRS